MSEQDRLSNDAILGIDIDSNIDPATSSIVQPNLQNTLGGPSNASNLNKPKRRTDKLTSDILLSGRGLPKLLNQFRRFKFIKKSKKSSSFKNPKHIYSSYQNNNTYGDDHHYKNLERILEIYQSLGHDLSPHLKFDRFMLNLARGVEDVYTKTWIRDQVREEMREKMEKETMIEAANEATENNNVNTHHEGNNPNDETREDEEEGEEWPKMFGGNGNTDSNINNLSTMADQNEDQDVELSHIRQTPMFSTFLRTSSQPHPSSEVEDIPEDIENDNQDDDMDAFDALRAVENETGYIADSTVGGLQDFLSDDENGDSAPVAAAFSQSQYLATESQTATAIAADDPKESEEPKESKENLSKQQPDFSDDDFSEDDASALLL